MLPDEKKSPTTQPKHPTRKIRGAMSRLMEVQGALTVLASYFAQERDDDENLHLEAITANCVERHIRELARKTERAFVLLWEYEAAV